MLDYIDIKIPTCHKTRTNCACTVCKEMRNKGCPNPAKCMLAALKKFNTINPQWDPRIPSNTDNLDLTAEEITENERARK
jgi:ribonuclease HI